METLRESRHRRIDDFVDLFTYFNFPEERPFDEEWRREFVDTALAHEDCGVRDNAVDCIEQWEDEEWRLEVLSRYVEDERIDWLKKYMLSVLDDLKNGRI